MKIRILPLVFALSVAALAGCSAGSEQDGSAEADVAGSATISSAGIDGLNVDIAWGESGSGVMSKGDRKKTWAIGFKGKAGDKVNATLSSTSAGAAYIYKDVGDHKLAQVLQVAKEKSKDAILATELRTEGHFYIAFTPDLAGADYTSFGVSLDGTPANADDAWLMALKNAYVNESAENDFAEIPDTKLPRDAKKALDKLNKQWGDDYPAVADEWTFKGKKVFIVQESNDGGMTIQFFDASGKWIAGGGASESGEFGWD